jgi:predicted dehydrogenase
MAKIKIGLIGCGRWGRHILRDLVALNCEVAVASISQASRDAALQGGAVMAVAEAAQLPQALDGYVVAVKTVKHYDVVCELLPSGKPIFCEKPLTADARQACDLATRAADQLFVMDKWRYHPAIEAMAKLAHSGSLGKVQAIDCRRLQWGTSQSDVDLVWTVAPHELSIMQHILGFIPAPRAATGEWNGERLEGITVLLGDCPHASTQISARYPQHRREVRMTCEGGVVLMEDPYADHIDLYRIDAPCFPNSLPKPETLPVSTEYPLLRELRQFCNYLDGGPPPLSNAVAAAQVVVAIEQIRDLALQSRASCPP